MQVGADRNMCACVFFYLLHIEYQNLHSTSKGRTFYRSEDILTGPCNFKGLSEGSDLVLRLGLKLGLG